VAEWLNRDGCKQKEYFDELKCARELTSFFGGHRQFDLAVKAACKAVTITMLHRREDEPNAGRAALGAGGAACRQRQNGRCSCLHAEMSGVD